MSDPTDTALWGLVAAAVPSGVVGLVSFFAKRAFHEVETGIAKIGAQVEELHKSFTSQDKAVALIEAEGDTVPDMIRVGRTMTCAQAETLVGHQFCFNGGSYVELLPASEPSECCAAKLDAGLLCRMRLDDGGIGPPGVDRIIGPCSRRVAPNTACYPVPLGLPFCDVVMGESAALEDL